MYKFRELSTDLRDPWRLTGSSDAFTTNWEVTSVVQAASPQLLGLDHGGRGVQRFNAGIPGGERDDKQMLEETQH